LVRQALADRSELKERRLQEGAAQRFTKAEHALSFPSLSLMGATDKRGIGVLRRDIGSRHWR
jgi:hypothetical protein